MIHRFAHRAMNCEFGVAVEGEAREDAARAARAAFSEADRLEGELSRFRGDSDLARIAALSRGATALVGADTVACLRIAERVRRLTGGAFDPGFRTPSHGRAVVAIARRPPRVTALVDRPRLDLGGVGKGYAVDRMAELLAEWGARSVLVHAGTSTVRVVGRRRDGGRWAVGLRDPDGGAASLGTVGLASGEALSASAQREKPGHIRDPRTGRRPSRPATWAYARGAALSDALSTAFLVLPTAAIRRVCRRFRGIGGAIATGRPPRLAVARFGVLRA